MTLCQGFSKNLALAFAVILISCGVAIFAIGSAKPSVAQPPLSITSITPDTGPFYGGTPVTIMGSGFDPTPGNTSFSLGTDPDTDEPNDFTDIQCASSTLCTAVTPFAANGPTTGTVDVIATVASTSSAANPPADDFTFESTIATASKNVAYVYDFGSGVNDTSGPGSGSGIFVNAVGNPSWGGVPPGTGDTATWAGVSFTDVPVSTVDANPASAFNGYDTVILYEVCDIGSHPSTISAVNSFLKSGGKVVIYDADRCYPGTESPDYSAFIYPFATSNPGPQGASGSYSVVQPSSLTAGLAVGPVPYDAVGDANVFTTYNGAWCASITGTNILGTSGYIQAYATTPAGGLVIYNGEDNWFTDQPSNHLAQVFSLSLAEPNTGLPCGVVASGITLAPTSASDLLGSSQTMTASVVTTAGTPVGGISVTFAVTSGPDAGITGSAITNSSGKATFSYTDSTNPGVDQVQASFVDATGNTHNSNQAAITWSPAQSPTTLDTELSDGTHTGTSISVAVGTAVTDSATLSGQTASAGGTVTYTVYSDPTCTNVDVSGGTVKVVDGDVPMSNPVTLSAPGTYYWQAKYSGDSSNAPSSSSCGPTGEVETVTATTVTINVSGSQLYGGSQTEFTYTDNAPSGTSLDGSIVCTRVGTDTPIGPALAVDAYSVEGSSCSGLSASGYNIVYVGVSGGFTVLPAPLTLTASSATILYGNPPPAITASYDGFVNGDTSSSLVTKPECSTSASRPLPVGKYPTSCSGATDPNYDISYVGGTLTVGSAPLMITASSATIPDGNPPPVITASYDGFVNGDTSSSLATKPSCSTTATDLSLPGTYPTTCSGASDPNYEISYVNGTLTLAAGSLASSGGAGTGSAAAGTGSSTAGSSTAGSSTAGSSTPGSSTPGSSTPGSSSSPAATVTAAPPETPAAPMQSATPALAPEQPSVSPAPATRPSHGAVERLVLSAPSSLPGGTLTAFGTGCTPDAPVTLTVENQPSGKSIANGSGAFSLPIVLPNLPVGEYSVAANCGPVLTNTVNVILSSDANSTTTTSVVLVFFVLVGLAVVRRQLF